MGDSEETSTTLAIGSSEQSSKEESLKAQRMKHPLENTWSLWLNTNKRRNHKWEDNLTEITSFDTVEDFWCLYHHIKLPSELEDGQDYSIFKKGVQPTWEHQANRNGGRWLITFDQNSLPGLDSIWLDVVLLMIGESFKNVNHFLIGAIINIRPRTHRTKICIWLANKNKKKENILIAKKIKETITIPLRRTISFYEHNSNKALYTL